MVSKPNATRPRDKNQTKQDYETPDDFFKIISNRFNFQFDLAAHAGNKKCLNFFSPENDGDGALVRDWPKKKWNWLNPPFKEISHGWAQQCYIESLLGAQTVMLTPLCSANWVYDWVYEKAVMVALKGRLKFKGCKDVYPKDCMISIYFNPEKYTAEKWFHIWDWRTEPFPRLLERIKNN